MQLALFDIAPAQPTVDLPLARPLPANPRVLHTQDCYFETIVDKAWRLEIGIGRNSAGYHHADSHMTGWSGHAAPVFVGPNPQPDFATARHAAWQSLIDRLTRELTGPNYSHLSDGQKATLRAMIERGIEAAARNLAKVKGRHHAEIAMNRLQATLAASE